MINGFNLVQRKRFEEGEGEGESGNPAQTPNPDPIDEGSKLEEGDKGNKPKPSDREAELLREVMDKKDRLRAMTGEIDTLKATLQKYDGINVEEVQAMLQERKDRERSELEKRGEFDRVKEQMVEEHKAEIGRVSTELNTQVGTLSEQLQQAQVQITELTIGRAFGDSAFVRDTLTLTPAKTRVVYGSHFELQDGKVVAYDKPTGHPERTVLVDGSGSPLAFEAAIEKIVKADPDHEHLIRSEVRKGSGSKNDPTAKVTQKISSGRDRIGAAIAGGALRLPK